MVVVSILPIFYEFHELSYVKRIKNFIFKWKLFEDKDCDLFIFLQ